MNSYVRRLEAVKDQRFHELKEIGDQWRTGDALFHGIETLCLPSEKRRPPKFVLDLFTDGQNSKCPDYFTAEDNALLQDWTGRLQGITEEADYAFANPPYSIIQSDEGDIITGMAPIMEKALEEREQGGRFAFLIKAATSETWWPDSEPDRTYFIKGRVAFERPEWFRPEKPVSRQSAFFGCAVLVFNKHLPRDKEPVYIHRKELLAFGRKRAEELAEIRQRHIQSFSL
ncbi:phage N-6-adenine-methyltransferase (plasmid) [Enterobacter hormaechei]|jgi:phage N-6-adenine-methyltransferase|uniref:phage N-6-adenine-methyltransferase n=1 Tax=Enterobacter hormaechei TaxID=158836 RepID=UPI002B4BB1B0|nr:phage N-6-adenine-methyltransferase [Enterobacter hormaechei]WRM07111.1 phage N-6-adenine-methyltransferase [Enterobacter hormaechei]